MQVKVLDASWYLKTMNKDARAEFSARRIPGCDPNHYFETPTCLFGLTGWVRPGSFSLQS